ncbi:NUDIX domain-containing protein [Streptomyces sp. NPDC093249]|uniref:NUDIX domain-containing protein n=1 Tax=unclassified Streptomyces TaxID=2593676 RepID=UPI0038309944
MPNTTPEEQDLRAPSLPPAHTPTPSASSGKRSETRVLVATATREGTDGPTADAVRYYTAADHTTAVAVVDGAGHSPEVVDIVPVLAEAAARTGAAHFAVRGVLSAAALVSDRGPDGKGPRAVVAVAVCPPDDMTMASWCGDARVYGWDGQRLRLYSTDQTVAEHMRGYLGITGPLPAQAHDFLRGDLPIATLETVPGVRIPANEVIIVTSDGVHDQVPADRIEQLVREHVLHPQRLADELVNAAEPNSRGYRDDATAAILVRPEARQSPSPPHEESLTPLTHSYTATTVLITDDADRLLILKPRHRDHWQLPGGAVDHGEDPETCARRELLEKTGLDFPMQGILVVMWGPPGERLDGPAINLVFDAGTVPSGTTDSLPENELEDHMWVSTRRAAELLLPEASYRMHAALEARETGLVKLLSSGNDC